MRRLFLGLCLYLCGISPLGAQQGPNPPTVGPNTLQNAVTANANGSALNTQVAGYGFQAVTFVVSGTFSATVNFEATQDTSKEATQDTSKWVSLSCYPTSGGAAVTTATSAGGWRCNLGGAFVQVRARISGYVSGSVTVTAASSYQGLASNGQTPLDSIAGAIAAAGTGVLRADSGTASVVGAQWLDLSTCSDGTLVNCVASIGSTTVTTLGITKVTTVATSVTVTSNITLLFLGAGQLSINSGTTVTINGPLLAPMRYIFAGSGTVVLGGLVDRRYPEWAGAVGNDSTDDNTALQASLTWGGVIILSGGKTYLNTAANLTTVAGTRLIVEKGATLHLNGTRLTTLNSNDVFIELVGDIKSTSLNTTDGFPSGWAGRGIIEFGGTSGTPVQRVGIEGPGRLYGDWTGTPGSIIINSSDKRRGVLLQFVQDAFVRKVNISAIVAEAVWHNAGALDRNIDIVDNIIHDSNFDAISAQQTIIPSFRTKGNIAWNCYNGIESPVGLHDGNFMYNMKNSGYLFGGNELNASGQPIVFINNIGSNNAGIDYDIESAGTPIGTVIVDNNTSYNAGNIAFAFSTISNLIVTRNKAIGWATSTAGVGFSVINSVTRAVVDGNVLLSPAANSTGGYSLAAATQLVWGLNYHNGVATPQYNTDSTGEHVSSFPTPVASAVSQKSHTGDINLTTLDSETVYGQTFGKTGGVEIIAAGTLTGTTGSKTVNLSYGMNSIINNVIPSATTGSWFLHAVVMNSALTGIQYYSSQLNAGTAIVSIGSGSIATDSTVNQTVSVAVQLGNSGDTFTMNTFIVKPLLGLLQK